MFKLNKSLMFFLFLINSFALSEQKEEPSHLKSLIQLQENVPAHYSSYSYKTPVVKWKEERGGANYICCASCSSLINALIKQCYGLNLEDLHEWLGGRLNPKSKDYYRAILNRNGFERVKLAQDVAPGDMIAIKYLENEHDFGDGTGHIMIVLNNSKKPEAYMFKGVKINRWAMEVIDSSYQSHGKHDSRFHGGSFRSGLGKGYIALYADPDGQILGYSWSLEKNAPFYGDERRPLAVGRLQSDFLKRFYKRSVR